MSTFLSADFREKVCQKFLTIEAQSKVSNKEFVSKLVGVLRETSDSHLSNALVDNKLLPEKYRAGLMKVEQIAIDGVLSPEALGLTIYDVATMDVDPWEMIEVRGWQNGDPNAKQHAELDARLKDLEEQMNDYVNFDKRFQIALEKIEQQGLSKSMTETVEGLAHPFVCFKSDEQAKIDREVLRKGLEQLIGEFGNREVEAMIVEVITLLLNRKQLREDLSETPLSFAYLKLTDEIWGQSVKK